MVQRLLHKDIKYALEIAKNTKTSIFIGALGQEIHRLAEAKGLGEEADYAIINIFEEANGLHIRPWNNFPGAA